MMKRKKPAVYYLAAVLFWLAVWQAGVSVINRNLLIPVPTPTSTAAALIRLAADRSFFHAVFLSIARIAAGFLCAFAAGTILAVFCVKSEMIHILCMPLLALIRSIPVASFTILVFLWVTRERIPSVITFFTVLPVIWANVESGLRAADEGLVEMARVFGMPGGRIMREILLPSIRPYFSSAAASGIGFAWKSGVAAEVICRTQDSLGNLLWAGKSSVDYDEVFAVTLVIVLLSMLLQGAAGKLLRRRTAGQKEDSRSFAHPSKEGSGEAGLRKEEIPAREKAELQMCSQSAADSNASAAEKAPAAIRFDHVSFGYSLRRALFDNVSLEIRSGERFCLSGASGSGKTTFLGLLMGLLRPKSGSIVRPDDLSISAVFQEDRLIPWKSVLDNVLLFGDGDVSSAKELLGELGLAESMYQLPDALSGGMKRRAALARALYHRFDLLVLDEAFTGLDAGTKETCLAVCDRAAEGRILIMASHDLTDAEALHASVLDLSRFRS